MDCGENVVTLDFGNPETLTDRRSAAFDRLQQAVSNMEAELKAQREGVEQYRHNLERLMGEITEMGETFKTFHDHIGNTKLGSLRQSSKRLGQIADDWLNRSR